MWALTVRSAMPRVLASSLFEGPPARWRRTCRSRSVRRSMSQLFSNGPVVSPLLRSRHCRASWSWFSLVGAQRFTSGRLSGARWSQRSPVPRLWRAPVSTLAAPAWQVHGLNACGVSGRCPSRRGSAPEDRAVGAAPEEAIPERCALLVGSGCPRARRRTGFAALMATAALFSAGHPQRPRPPHATTINPSSPQVSAPSPAASAAAAGVRGRTAGRRRSRAPCRSGSRRPSRRGPGRCPRGCGR